MTTCRVQITPDIAAGDGAPLLVIAGPCVIESEDLCLSIARRMKDICRRMNVNYIFKASFDKANRTSVNSFRGPGLEKGLAILESVRQNSGVLTLTDIHEPEQAAAAAAVVDILQIPAFLCRQTDLLLAAARTGKAVTVKKGQFLAPEDMRPVVDKLTAGGCEQVLLTERGTTLGYHNLVVDMRSLVVMRQLGVPVIFDATHAVQQPGGEGSHSGGRREFVFPLARAAAAVGIDGLFLEVHPTPDRAKSDAANSVALDDIEEILKKVLTIHDIARNGSTG